MKCQAEDVIPGLMEDGLDRFMESSTRIEKGTTIVDVVGQIDLGNSPALRKTLLDVSERQQIAWP